MKESAFTYCIGWWRQGTKTGTWWTRVLGDGWHVTNDKSDSSIFIFPDLVTALVGQMNSNETASNSDLTVCQVTNLGFEYGIVLPGLTKCGQNLSVFKSETWIFNKHVFATSDI